MLPYFQRALRHIGECVLDGEMMTYNPEEKCFRVHSYNHGAADNMLRNPKSVDRESGGDHLCYEAFDLLWAKDWTAHPELEGDLTLRPLSVRKQLLVEALPLSPGSSLVDGATTAGITTSPPSSSSAASSSSSSSSSSAAPAAAATAAPASGFQFHSWTTFIEPLPGERLMSPDRAWVYRELSRLFETAVDRCVWHARWSIANKYFLLPNYVFASSSFNFVVSRMHAAAATRV